MDDVEQRIALGERGNRRLVTVPPVLRPALDENLAAKHFAREQRTDRARDDRYIAAVGKRADVESFAVDLILEGHATLGKVATKPTIMR